MKIRYVIAILALAFGTAYWVRSAWGPAVNEPAQVDGTASYARVVSLAPSVTEVIFAVGGGDKLVGVTRYCTFPPEAAALPKVGGFLDPNYEAILTLEPDLTVLLSVHGDAEARLSELGIATLVAEHRTLEGILDSIRRIGQALGARENAEALLAELHGRMDHVRERTRGLPRPRVLISAGRSYGVGRIEQIHAAGRNQWYDDVITLAGGENAYQDEGIPFPELSGEGLLRLNPEVIVEMAAGIGARGITEEAVVADWAGLTSMDAVRTGRIHVISADYATIPGPRFIEIVEDLARVLHPTVDFGPR